MRRVIAVTGGIGSGKSAVISILRKKGFDIISADEVNKRLLNDMGYLSELERLFPDAFVNGVFDKRKLSGIVFNDESERLKLNAIAHKRIGDIIRNEVVEINGIVFVEVPLLIESGLLDIFDDVVVVTASPSVRVERVMSRDGVDEDRVKERMNVQTNDSVLIYIATYVIRNDSTIESLSGEVEKVVSMITKKCRQ